MSDGERLALHEAGHAVAAHLLGRRNLELSIEPPEPRSVDTVADVASLPGVHWCGNETDAMILLAGPISAGYEVEFPDPTEECGGASDFGQAEWMLRAITGSEEEYRALALAIRLRTEALTRHPHFVALRDHLADALMRDGHLCSGDIRVELMRAQLRYENAPLPPHTPTRIEEGTDDAQAA